MFRLPFLNRRYRSTKSDTPLLLSARNFERELVRERQRADRRALSYCVIELDLLANNCQRQHVLRTARLLHRRLRITDTVGYRGASEIGIILTDTPFEGGRVVANELRQMMSDARLHCDLRMYVYDPDAWRDDANWPPDEDEHYDFFDNDSGEGRHVAPVQLPRAVERQLLKRAIDVVGSSVGLILAAIPLVIACAAIRLTTNGPAIYRQVREGRGGRPFTIYKLRTMYVNAEQQQGALRAMSERDGPAFKMKNDPRITPVGRFLRATCIDELPQFLNVFLGHMSLVGPRPLPWSESRSVQSWQRRRLDVKPGITGIWQTTKHEGVSFDEWMRMDLRYIDRIGTWTDVKLIAQTVVVPIKRRGNH